MNYRKIAMGVAALATVCALGASIVFAREGEDDVRAMMGPENMQGPKQMMQGEKPGDMMNGEARSVTIKGNGEFQVKGAEAVGVNASSGILTVKLYGYTKDINVSGAKISGVGGAMTLADIQPGDKLSGSGMLDEVSHVITVREIRDTTPHGNNSSSYLQQRSEELKKLIQDLLNRVNALRGQQQQ